MSFIVWKTQGRQKWVKASFGGCGYFKIYYSSVAVTKTHNLFIFQQMNRWKMAMIMHKSIKFNFCTSLWKLGSVQSVLEKNIELNRRRTEEVVAGLSTIYCRWIVSDTYVLNNKNPAKTWDASKPWVDPSAVCWSFVQDFFSRRVTVLKEGKQG